MDIGGHASAGMTPPRTCVEMVKGPSGGRPREVWRAQCGGKAESGPGVIESAFELLEILRALGRARLTELTAESALPRTTVYRLLGQLAAVGAVERIGAHYRLGPGPSALGQHVTPMERLRAIAQRPLIELAAATPAHVGLATTTSRMPMYLEVLDGRDRLPIRRVPGGNRCLQDLRAHGC